MKTKEDKLNEIERLKKILLEITKKIIKIASLPQPKRNSTAIRRAFNIMALSIEARTIQEKIKIVISQPVVPPNLPDGVIKIYGEKHCDEKLINNFKKNNIKNGCFLHQ